MAVETLGHINMRTNSIGEPNAVRFSPRKFGIPGIRRIVESFVSSSAQVKFSIMKDEKVIGRIRGHHLHQIRTLTEAQQGNLLDEVAERLGHADTIIIESTDPWKYI
ncbi:MAG: hypothetical protein AAB675_03955 [Patescibacteria group bacterium]